MALSVTKLKILVHSSPQICILGVFPQLVGKMVSEINYDHYDYDDDDEKAVPPVQTVCERGALFLRALNSQRLLLMIMMVMMMTIMQRTRMLAMNSKSNQLTIWQSLL